MHMAEELYRENGQYGASLLSMRGITKKFGGVIALKDIDFVLHTGEIVALIGDNGAGKSTLIKIISGVYEPDEGEIFIEGEKVKNLDPLQARNMGIETVYQDLALFEIMDVTANLFAGREIKNAGVFLNKKKMERLAKDSLNKTGISIRSLRQRVAELSGGQKHAVAIARTVYVSGSPNIILMDEPTAGLGVKESDKLLDIIKNLRKAGKAVILITHNLDHAFIVADRFVILREGMKVGERLVDETNSMELIEMMVGVVKTTNHNST